MNVERIYMLIYEDTFQTNVTFDLKKIANPEKIVFLDIETTGFSARTSYLSILGLAYLKDHVWHYKQWFLDDPNQEKDLLIDFFSFMKDYTTIITFNGDQFDLPFLLQRCNRYLLSYDFDRYQTIDYYKLLSPYKKIMHLPNAKQKTYELFAGIDRKDQLDGRLLIPIYKEYLTTKEEMAKNVILLHNMEDITYLVTLTNLLSYYELFKGKSMDKLNDEAIYGTYREDKNENSLSIHLTFPYEFPRDFFHSFKGHQLVIKKNQVTFIVSSQSKNFHHYFVNYKDYYYLPEEDYAIYKDLASYVPGERKVKADPYHCYSNFKVTKDFLNSKTTLRSYAKSLISWMVLVS